MKKILIPTLLTIATAPFISMVSCNEKDPEPEPQPEPPQPIPEPTSIKLDKNMLSLKIGQSDKLTPTVYPLEASQEVEWACNTNDLTIADDGTVTVVALNNVMSTVSVWPKGYKDTIEPAQCLVYTSYLDPTSMELLTPTPVNLEVRGINSMQVKAKISPELAYQKVYCISNNQSVALTSMGDTITANPNCTSGTTTVDVYPAKWPSAGYYSDIKQTITVNVTLGRYLFNECDWDVLDMEAQSLESGAINDAEFCSKFKVYDLSTPDPNDTKDVTSLNDFVGQTRTVHTEYGDCLAKVIGIKQDFQYYNSSTSEFELPAVFTFELQSYLPSHFDSEPFPWDGDYNDYFGSQLYNEGLIDAFYIIDEGLAGFIRPICRRVQTAEGVQMTDGNYMFLPTLSDYFSGDGLKASGLNNGYYAAESTHSGGKFKTSQYIYYQRQIDNAPLIQNGQYIAYDCLYRDPSLIDQDGIGWLCSPSYETTDCVWAVNNDQTQGKMNRINVDEQAAYLAPCFCI